MPSGGFGQFKVSGIWDGLLFLLFDFPFLECNISDAAGEGSVLFVLLFCP